MSHVHTFLTQSSLPGLTWAMRTSPGESEFQFFSSISIFFFNFNFKFWFSISSFQFWVFILNKYFLNLSSLKDGQGVHVERAASRWISHQHFLHRWIFYFLFYIFPHFYIFTFLLLVHACPLSPRKMWQKSFYNKTGRRKLYTGIYLLGGYLLVLVLVFC